MSAEVAEEVEAWEEDEGGVGDAVEDPEHDEDAQEHRGPA